MSTHTKIRSYVILFFTSYVIEYHNGIDLASLGSSTPSLWENIILSSALSQVIH